MTYFLFAVDLSLVLAAYNFFNLIWQKSMDIAGIKLNLFGDVDKYPRCTQFRSKNSQHSLNLLFFCSK